MLSCFMRICDILWYHRHFFWYTAWITWRQKLFTFGLVLKLRFKIAFSILIVTVRLLMTKVNNCYRISSNRSPRPLLAQLRQTLGLYSRPGLYLRPGFYSRKYGSYKCVQTTMMCFGFCDDTFSNISTLCVHLQTHSRLGELKCQWNSTRWMQKLPRHGV